MPQTALERVHAQHAADSELSAAHDYLRSDCPWYKKVSAGAPEADFKQYCEPAGKVDEGTGVPRLVVKLTPRTPEASTVDKPTRPAGGPGLFHVKGLHLPPYIQHLWFHLVKEYGEQKAYGVAVGVVKKWAAGVNPGGKHPTHTHADVRAAAAKNVAQWEADKAKAHASHGGGKTQGDHALAATMALAAGLAPSPGAGPLHGLHQRPAATVSPSPPLPPKVKAPTAQEVRKLIPDVPKCEDLMLSNQVRLFLETAAVKLDKNDQLEALRMLRLAGTAIIPAHKKDLGLVMPSVYTASAYTQVPPAEQSSAMALRQKGRDRAGEWRTLERSVQGLADRIRKRYFHGIYNGPSQQARLTEGNMTALDKVLALAVHDVSFPTESDTSREVRPLSLPASIGAPAGKAKEELDSLSPVGRLRIGSDLSTARDCLAKKDNYGARQCVARALACASQCGAHHLKHYLYGLSLALQASGSITPAGAASNPGSGGSNSPDHPVGNSHRY